MKTERSMAIKDALHSYVNSRLSQALKKLEGKEDAQSKKAREKAQSDYDFSTIITDGAKYADQVQIATHVAKATHPDLPVKKVTNLILNPEEMNHHDEIGSHSLMGINWNVDATGNGAVNKKGYELYLLLNVKFNGDRFIDLLIRDDLDALYVLSDDLNVARRVAESLVEVANAKCPNYSSSTLAKQVYWCISGEPTQDDGFHLLQPLFSSSLAHVVHQEIQDARFGDENNDARQAKSKKVAHDTGYRDYRNLAVRKFGGTKPQNISQLNSERGGVNYLLASLPPTWNHDRPRNFLFIDSGLDRFTHYEGVSDLLSALRKFLRSDPDPTMERRIKRERLEQALGQSLAAFGVATRQLLEPGWTRAADCNLPLCEKLWLDPGRAELPLRPEHEQDDREFQEAFQDGDWPDQVAHRFGNWLNTIFLKEGLPVGDAEHAHWAKQAIIDAEWPVPIKQRNPKGKLVPEVDHG